MAKIRTIIFSQCKSERECEEFEIFINNLDQYMGKPRHVVRIGRVDIKTTFVNDGIYKTTLVGDEEAVNIATMEIVDTYRTAKEWA